MLLLCCKITKKTPNGDNFDIFLMLLNMKVLFFVISMWQNRNLFCFFLFERHKKSPKDLFVSPKCSNFAAAFRGHCSARQLMFNK